MSILTCCPSCHTVFRVTSEHLAAREGQVRCGVCSQVFNAYDYLTPEHPTSVDEVAASPEATPEATPEVVPEAPQETFVDTEAARVLDWSMFKFHEEPAISTAPVNPPPEIVPEPEALPAPAEIKPEAAPSVLDWDAVPEPIAATRVTPSKPESEPAPAPAAEIAPSVAELARKQHHRTVWLGIASGVLALMLALQAVYFWRTTLAARLPVIQPWLAQACDALGCGVGLPQDDNAISVSSSDLLSDPAHPATIHVNLLIANQAGYVEAYPHIELTLTDTQNAIVARRIFTPKEYLPSPAKRAAGIAAGTEASVDLTLNVGTLAAAGYRVLVFYP